MQNDDKFIVFHNGVKMASVNVGGAITCLSSATSAVTGSTPANAKIDLSNCLDLLVTAENVLAIQGLDISDLFRPATCDSLDANHISHDVR